MEPLETRHFLRIDNRVINLDYVMEVDLDRAGEVVFVMSARDKIRRTDPSWTEWYEIAFSGTEAKAIILDTVVITPHT